MSWLAWIALLGPFVAFGLGWAFGWGHRGVRDAKRIEGLERQIDAERRTAASLRRRLENALSSPRGDALRDRLRDVAESGGAD